jgi:hypothetical protein
MTDILHAMGQLPFVSGFIAGGCVFFFLGLAIGWAKGHHAGWSDGWQRGIQVRDGLPDERRVHNW